MAYRNSKKRYIAAKLNAVLMQLSSTNLEVVFLHVLVYASLAVKPNDFLLQLSVHYASAC